jgi:dienelactone hydrolase
MARRGAPLRGVASFHGALGTEKPAEPGKVRAAIFVAHGAADAMIPPEQVAAFQEEMKNAGARLDFVAYEGALHSFTNPDADALGKQFGMPVAYDAAADRESWKKLESFLSTVFAN